MATETLDDVSVSEDWTDLVATHAGLASADATIQNAGGAAVAVVFGGAAAPTNKSGFVIGPREYVRGAAANVWVKSLGASARVSVTKS